MKLNLFTPHTVTNQLQIVEPTLLHIIPEFGTNLIEILPNLNISTLNCHGIYIDNKVLKIKTTSQAPTEYINILHKHSKLKVLNNLVDIPEKKFVIVDHSILSKVISGFPATKVSLNILLEYLDSFNSELKKSQNSFQTAYLFTLNKQIDGLQSLLQYLPLIKELPNYDKFVLAAVFSKDEEPFITPILGYDNKGNKIILKTNLLNVNKQVVNTTPESVKLTVPSTEEKKQIELQDISNIDVNKKQLTTLLQSYNLKDPSLINNVQSAIKQFKEANLSATDKSIEKDNLELLILKAINYSVFNTPEIDQKYLDNPAELFKKLSIVNSFKVDVTYPETKDPQAVDAKDVIDLKQISGPVRHQFEFDESIHSHVKRLFSGLENKKLPIKINSIKYEYIDNNRDRLIQYNINCKNLASDNKEPFDLKINLPALVNNKYFKLNGKEYLLTSQLFLNPITKDSWSVVKFLSHYNMATLSVENIRLNFTELNDILKYITSKYPKVVESYDGEKLVLTNGITVNLLSSPYYTDKELELVRDNGKYKVKIEGQFVSNVNKNEFIFGKLFKFLQEINPEEKLSSSKRTIPFAKLHIVGIEAPLILYAWSQLGLLESLIRLGIDCKTSDSLDSSAFLNLKLKGNEFLNIYAKSHRDQLLVNGLTIVDILSDMAPGDLSSTNSIHPFLIKKYGTRAITNFNLFTENMIDPTTKELLEFYNYPTDVISVVLTTMVDKLFNDTPSHPADLSLVRVRQAEYITHLIYNEINMAYNKYDNNVNLGNKNAKMFLDESYVIDNLLGRHSHSSSNGGALLEYCEAFSPVDELIKASKLSRGGAGGIPSKRSYKSSLRTIHPSHIGNISAHSTSEYTSVGIDLHSTLGVNLSNHGVYGGKIDQGEYDSLNIDEALTPFCDQMSSDRFTIARTHMGQKIAIKEGEAPIVQSGAEYIVPQIASTKFVNKAKADGTVINVQPNKFMTVKYNNGNIENINIRRRYSTTKRNSILTLDINTLQPGDKFKKDELIAWSDHFDGKNNVYAEGRNCKLAIINYLGNSFEDGYVITDKLSNKYTTSTISKISVIIPPSTKVIKISKLNDETKINDALIEFQYLKSLDDYVEKFDVFDEDIGDGEFEDLSIIRDNRENKTIKKLSPGGKLIDIKIHLNTSKEMDPVVISLWKEIVAEIKEIQKNLTMYATNNKDRLIDNVDFSQLEIGKHKNKGVEFEGALIEFYIDSKMKLDIGNKLSNRYGAKGVVVDILDDEMTPKGEFSDEIDIFLAPVGLMGRKNTAILKELYIGKILYFLPEITSQLATKNYDKCKEIILKTYELLDPTKEKRNLKSIESKFKDEKFKSILINKEFKFNIIIPPFNPIKFKDIKKAAELLKLPLDERVYFPKLGTWSKYKVPVGIQYFSAMEQTADDYANIRSTAGYNSLTSQPVKGRARSGGESFGGLDVNAHLAYGNENIIKELIGARSDNFQAKIELISNLQTYGKSNLPEVKSTGQTAVLFNIMMLSQGLFVNYGDLKSKK